MASRNSSQGKPSEGGRATRQKARKADEPARASGGGLRKEPVAEPAGRSASTGGATTRGMAKSDANSRSSNAGNQRSQRKRRQP